MPIRPGGRGWMRLLFAAVLGSSALASPASAKYLHLSDAQAAAQQYVDKIYAPGGAPVLNVKLGHCWRASTHVDQCGFTDLPSSTSFTRHRVAVIALRGERLYGHTLALGPLDRAFDGPEIEQPRFIRRLG